MKKNDKTDSAMKSIRAPWEIAGMPKETPVLLALSGGADSTALLEILYEQSQRDGFPLSLAHFEHGIRGEESLHDAEFCKMLAGKYGLELTVENASIPTLAKLQGKGIEETAREARYDFLRNVMQKKQIPILVTAHHADDQMETVLFRLCRGSGLRGLSGIPEVRSFGNGVLVRPLLNLSKREILNFCKEKDLQFVKDSTNEDKTYARNAIREEVIPVLERLFDGTQERVSRMAKTLSEDESFLRAEAKRVYEELGGGESLPLKELQILHPAVQKRVFELWAGVELESVHLENLQNAVSEAKDGTSVSLPQKLSGRIQGKNLSRTADDWREEKARDVAEEIPFCEGEKTFGVWKIFVKKQTETAKIHNFSTAERMIFHTKSDIIRKECFWRLAKVGDEIYQGGMHKKIGKRCRELGICQSDRKEFLLLCDAKGIVWAPSLGFRDGLEKDGTAYEVSVQKIRK